MSASRRSLRRLGKDTLIYGLGVVLSRAASFIMLPVYTRYLSPADFGILQLLDMTVDAVTIILAGGIAAGVLRFYYKYESERERHSVFSTTLILSLATKVIGAVFFWWQAPWVAELLLDGADKAELIRIAASTFLIADFTLLPMLLLQAQKRPGLYSTASVSRLVVQLSLNILFVVVLGAGVRGILLSSLITSALSGAVLGFWMLRQTGFRMGREVARALIRFGLPYKATNVGTFIVTFGDRFFLKAYQGLASVGLYGLAYQFGFVLIQLTVSPFNKAWVPQRFQLVEESRAVRDRLYNQGFIVLDLLLVTGAVGISVFVRPLLTIMSDPEFLPAANLVPLILLAQVFAAWTWVVDFGIQVSERTKYVTYATWSGVAVILVLYALLIPRFGGYGAAIATIASFLTRCSVSYYWSTRLWPVSYRWAPHLRLLGFGAAAVVLNFVLTRGAGFGAQLAISTAVFAGFLLLTWTGGVLDRGDQERVLSALRARLRAIPILGT